MLVALSIQSCFISKPPKRIGFASVNNNVCKRLSEDVVIYAIFVDSKYTNPWSKHDILSTIDSINRAIKWIENKAFENCVNLNIKLDYHKKGNGMVPVKNDFSKKTLRQTLFKMPLWSGVKDVYRWADKIAKEAGRSVSKDTSSITNIKNNLKTRERLIARIRDIHKTDKVALMYFINNYYTDEISVTLDISKDNNVEFSIVSFKNPSVIAHEFLHLFGAYDLYITPFDTKKKEKRRKEELMKYFPNEIMAFAHRDIDSLEISGFTKYLIGWDKELLREYQDILFNKKYFAVKY